MGYPAKVQRIARKNSQQWFINFPIKALAPVRWRGAGEQNLRLVIIAPLQYRLSKQSHVLYREPPYLICTDPDLPLEKLLQAYLWRWGIEVEFRDEKTILGMGEAHVWMEKSVALVPAFITADERRSDSPECP